MGKISMTRIDYRLAHGQVATSWTKFLNAKRVVILDDEIVKDKLAMSMMRIGLSGIRLSAYTIQDGVAEYKKDKFGTGNIIVIFREIQNAFEAYQKGFQFSKLNVGQVPKTSERRRAVATINLSDAEMAMLKELHEAGVEIYNQQTISEKKYTYTDIENSMK